LLRKASIPIIDRKINCTEICSTGYNLRIGKKQQLQKIAYWITKNAEIDMAGFIV